MAATHFVTGAVNAMTDMDFRDEVNAQLDRRKLTKLIDTDVISAEELANAPIVLECPKCKHHQDPDNDNCEKCNEDIS